MANKTGKRAGVKLSVVLLSVFLFMLLFAPSASAAIMGDVTGNGLVNVQDATLVMKYVLKLDTLTDVQKAVADVNGDSDINIQDVTLIMQKSLVLIEEFPPYVLGISKLLPGSNNKVQVFFSKEMNEASIIDRSKYTYNIGGSDIAVPVAVILTPANNGKSVLLDFSSTTITFIQGNKITVGRVKDLAGKTTAPLTTVTTIALGEYIGLEKAEATAVDRITLTIDAFFIKEDVDHNNFAINPGTDTYDTYAKAASLISVTYSAGKTFIVLETASDLPNNAAGVKVRTEAASGQGPTANTRDEFGNKLNFNNEVVSDKIAPVLLTAKVTSTTTIELTFSEKLNTSTFTTTTNGFSVTGGAYTLATVTIAADPNNYKVTITKTAAGDDFIFGTSKVTYNSVIGHKDLAGNLLAGFTDVNTTTP